MLLKNTKILKAILKEYGISLFLQKLTKLYNITIPNVDKDNVVIHFTPTKVEIKDRVNQRFFTILFAEEYYQFIDKQKEYTYVTFYDEEKIIFKRKIQFNISEEKILVLEELNNQNIKSRRLVKTDKMDKEALNGEYEKESLFIQIPTLASTYSYVKKEGMPTPTINKAITLPNSLYYYAFHELKPDLINNFNHGTIETAAITSYPLIKFFGRIRQKDELLKESQKISFPNIIMKINTHQGIENIPVWYKIIIQKYPSNMTLKIVANYNLEEIKEQEYKIPTKQNGKMTPIEIENVINWVSQNLHTPIDNLIIQELITLKDNILISKKQKTRQIDAIDLLLNKTANFNELALEIYENNLYYQNSIETSPMTAKKLTKNKKMVTFPTTTQKSEQNLT